MLEKIQTQLEHQFSDIALLEQAITHRSYLNEHPDYQLGHNERLEFLGDAVISMIASDWLYDSFSDMPEGQMTHLRIWIIRTETLADFGRMLDLGSALRMAKGEVESGGRQRNTLLCNCFEAVIGAFYLETSINAVREFLIPLFEPIVADVISGQKEKDPKSLFQEWSQAVFGITPTYQLIYGYDRDNITHFTVELLLENLPVSWGNGRNKQIAEQAAAQQALREAGKGNIFIDTADLVFD